MIDLVRLCTRAFLLTLLYAAHVERAFAVEESPLIVLQPDYAGNVSAAGAAVADAKGLFAKEGLSFRIDAAGKNDNSADDAAILVRLMEAREFLLSRAGGAPIVAIAANYADSPVLFYSRQGSKIRSPSDLAGKSVGYSPTSETGLVFEWFLNKNQISRSTFTEKQSNWRPGDLLNNQIEVLVGRRGEDDVALERAGFPFDTLDPRQYGVHILGSVYVITEAQLRRNPEALVRFLRALISGWELAYADLDQTALLISPNSASPAEIALAKQSLDRQRELIRPGGARFGESAKSRLTEMYAFMLQRRWIKSSIDWSRAIDTNLLAEAYRTRLDAWKNRQ